MPMVRRGDRGSLVAEVQGNLLHFGAHLTVDRDFGPLTEAAVRSFQRSHHLVPDGVVGPRTFTALHRRIGSTTRPANPDPFSVSGFAAWLAALPGEIYSAIIPNAPAPGAGNPSAQPSSPSGPTTTTPRMVGKPVVSPGQNLKHRRIAFPDYAGRGYVINDFEKYEGWAIELTPKVSIAAYDAKHKIRNECAQLVQFFGVPNTRSWRRGPQVCAMQPGELPYGTVVATLRDDRYYSDYSGRSHVGIYLKHDAYGTKGGMWLMDQYNGHPIDQRFRAYDGHPGVRAPIRAKGRRFDWVRHPEEYFVLLTS